MSIEDALAKLTAGLDRDEAIARRELDDWDQSVVNGVDVEGTVGGGPMEHIERHGPATVLRQVEAIRKVIAEHADNGSGKCLTCSPFYIYPCPTLRALAGIYTEPTEVQS